MKEDLGQSRVTAPETRSRERSRSASPTAASSRHSLEIVEVGDGHTAGEIKAAGEAWGEKGKPLPDWITFKGGIGSTKAGGSGMAVVDLPAGEYVAFDIEGKGKTPYAEFTVEGDEGEGLPEVPAVIEATEYDFTTSDLEAGSQQVRFQNNGEEPHHVVAAPLKPGKTIDDVKQFIKTEKGEPPIDESRRASTPRSSPAARARSSTFASSRATTRCSASSRTAPAARRTPSRAWRRSPPSSSRPAVSWPRRPGP